MKRAFQIATLLLAAMACASLGHAQSRPVRPSTVPAQSNVAQGELTVTLTIVPSVGVVLDANGQPKLIVANAADPADNVSSLKVFPAAEQKLGKKKK